MCNLSEIRLWKQVFKNLYADYIEENICQPLYHTKSEFTSGFEPATMANFQLDHHSQNSNHYPKQTSIPMKNHGRIIRTWGAASLIWLEPGCQYNWQGFNVFYSAPTISSPLEASSSTPADRWFTNLLSTRQSQISEVGLERSLSGYTAVKSTKAFKNVGSDGVLEVKINIGLTHMWLSMSSYMVLFQDIDDKTWHHWYRAIKTWTFQKNYYSIYNILMLSNKN